MRYAARTLVFHAFVLVAGCSGEPSEGDGARDAGPPSEVPTEPAPALRCGDADGLPDGTARDDAAHTVAIACDGDAKAIGITVLDDGLVRLRYGDAAAKGSLVAVTPPPAKSPLVVAHRGTAAVVCTKELEITVEPRRCTLVAKDLATGAVVLDDGGGGGYFRAQAKANSKDPVRAALHDVIGVAHASPEGERFYGLGLHTATQPGRGLDLRGSTIELWNTDAFDDGAGGFRPDAPSLYESIPFYVGLRGKTAYGLFTDNTHRLRFDLAASDHGMVRTTAWGGAIDQYLVAGPRMRDVLRRYTLLTGRTPMPPPWALGFHQSRWEGPCEALPADRPFCSAGQIVALAQSFRDRKIPADGLFLDIQHLDGFRSFTFDPARFADPEGMFTQLRALGFETSTIVDPGIKVDPTWDVYTSGVTTGQFLDVTGEVWAGQAAFPDFTADKTRAWWSDLTKTLATRGVRGMWIDMNEPASFTSESVADDVPANGDGHATTMAEVHNAYAYFEAKATRAGMLAARPGERPFVLSRAAFAGQQQHSAVWTGDAPSTWTTLGMTLPQLLHLGVSGIAFAGSDVGGYSGRAESTAELFSRWMALGSISPFFRAHAEENARRQEPWAFGTDTLDASRSLIASRYELMPYLYSVFDESSVSGAPVLRPLVYEFQDDEAAQTVADEAMLGPSLLVAPILGTKDAQGRAVSLPKGRWFELRSGAVLEGGTPVLVSAAPDPLPPDALPMFARAGAIVPSTVVGTNVASARGAVLTLDAFPDASPSAKSSFTLREDDGTTSAALSRITFTLARTATGLRFEASAREGAFVAAHAAVVVRLRRVDHAPTSVKLDGAPLAPSRYTWDANDRTLVVPLTDHVPFALDVAYDAALAADGEVDVPLRVKLPADTPTTTAIHVASSRAAWIHVPLVRTGDEAVGTLRVPRGGYTSFKISRGDWPTVEKGDACAERDNRRALGAASRTIAVTVTSWADRCP